MTIDAGQLRALVAAVPAEVRQVCQVLTDAGHQAVTVGGAVRDALLGRDAGDWDVASSATPDAVVALFPRTIPTGIQHGTVTVMIGRGERRIGVEVTTYRGEGAYSDARRPDHVVFGVPLDEDLARRDLVVNAIAYDPIRGVIHDPFGGRDDLAARRLRAVGDPVARFTEDGLRVMRAVRFAAVLEFALDPATEAAIAVALPSLRRVSQERIHDELVKLLAAARPSLGLEIARRTGVIAAVLPELPGADDAGWPATLAWIDAASDGEVRLAALLAAAARPEAHGSDGDPAAAKLADAALRRLKFSNEERERGGRLVRVAHAPVRAWEPAALRRLLAVIGRKHAAAAAELWAARGSPALASEARTMLDRGDPLAVGELAIGGAELMAGLGLPPGRQVGQLLAALLEVALDDPTLNTADALLAAAAARLRAV